MTDAPRDQSASEPAHYLLRLFIAGTTPRSQRAITNLRRISEAYLGGRYTIEVIDLYQEPGAAAAEQIVALPTLIKSLPEPMRRVIGDLSDREQVLRGLEIATDEPDTP